MCVGGEPVGPKPRERRRRVVSAGRGAELGGRVSHGLGHGLGHGSRMWPCGSGRAGGRAWWFRLPLPCSREGFLEGERERLRLDLDASNYNCILISNYIYILIRTGEGGAAPLREGRGRVQTPREGYQPKRELTL